ncbi:cell division protein ZapA [Sporanaerobium hydrogeniformans]|uniref:Cell division protein ZapA n=1 Tax=Sporanaerobium hydrogeniformans TaxID=3072179 RepID=A0AC61DE09_9FIRM|nr:cell division protein ZapA [Sporanaerobium hydrogeniformans]PHV71053.1 cell division protein ZapA [Sporanaerobium hydrogeniformans]
MSKNKVEVIIGGTILALQGEESEEHIQKVASLIDKQLMAIQKNNVRKNLNPTKVYMLAALNIANEYIKALEELSVCMDEIQSFEEEKERLKRELSALKEENAKLQLLEQPTYASVNRKKHINRGR